VSDKHIETMRLLPTHSRVVRDPTSTGNKYKCSMYGLDRSGSQPMQEYGHPSPLVRRNYTSKGILAKANAGSALDPR